MKKDQNLNLANPFLRVSSKTFDLLTYLLFYLALLTPILQASTFAKALEVIMRGIILLLFVPTLIQLINIFLISKLGGSLGKLIYGLGIVRESDLSNLSFKRAFFRQIVGYSASASLLGLGFLWILKDEKRRGWHDLVSDTIVVLKQKSLWILGTVLTLISLGINVYFLNVSFKNFSDNRQLYLDIWVEVSNDLKKIQT